MLNILREVRAMQQAGKIHRKLRMQIVIMTAMSIAMVSIVGYEVVFRGVELAPVSVLSAVGFLLGVYLFSPLNAATWDEEQEVVAAKRMDRLGFAAIGAYIVIVIGLRAFLNQNFHSEVTMLILSLVFGMLLGRVAGTIIEIHKAFRAARL